MIVWVSVYVGELKVKKLLRTNGLWRTLSVVLCTVGIGVYITLAAFITLLVITPQKKDLKNTA